MRRIRLTQGQTAIVDDADYESVAVHRWYANIIDGRWYAIRREKIDGEWRSILMHRQIMNAAPGIEIDHRDGDGLNNRRKNLRPATSRQNKQNRRCKTAGTTSRFKGVYLRPERRKRWCASIRDGKRGPDGRARKRFLGHFESEEEAARAYDAAARASFGEFAALNF